MQYQFSSSVHKVLSLAAVIAALAMMQLNAAAAGHEDVMARVTGATHEVPGDFATIQEAIDAAADGDLILLAPGTYNEGLILSGKSVTVASRFITTGDEAFIEQTILDGTTSENKDGELDYLFLVKADAGPDTQIAGLTIQDSDDGISCEADIYIVHNHFINCKDAIDYEGGGGVCAYNLFENNRDDAIDLDGPCGGYYEHNIIRNNHDDGIEIRLQPYDGPKRTAVIRNNWIEGNGEDGIQFIDYLEPTNREFVIERNYIIDSAMAGIGCMSGANTRENYEAADIDERILIINNTIVGSTYGITGGNCSIVLNNIIMDAKYSALRDVDYNSVVSHVLLWNNGRDNEGSNVTGIGVIKADPKLDEKYRPTAGSPVVDAGVAALEWHEDALAAEVAEEYLGDAPDLGAGELE